VLTEGLDPIFRTVDGSNCNHDVDASTLAGREAAYSLLRTRGLIEFRLPSQPTLTSGLSRWRTSTAATRPM
jgi:hypothetical protein